MLSKARHSFLLAFLMISAVILPASTLQSAPGAENALSPQALILKLGSVIIGGLKTSDEMHHVDENFKQLNAQLMEIKRDLDNVVGLVNKVLARIDEKSEEELREDVYQRMVGITQKLDGWEANKKDPLVQGAMLQQLYGLQEASRKLRDSSMRYNTYVADFEFAGEAMLFENRVYALFKNTGHDFDDERVQSMKGYGEYFARALALKEAGSPANIRGLYAYRKTQLEDRHTFGPTELPVRCVYGDYAAGCRSGKRCKGYRSLLLAGNLKDGYVETGQQVSYNFIPNHLECWEDANGCGQVPSKIEYPTTTGFIGCARLGEAERWGPDFTAEHNEYLALVAKIAVLDASIEVIKNLNAETERLIETRN